MSNQPVFKYPFKFIEFENVEPKSNEVWWIVKIWLMKVAGNDPFLWCESLTSVFHD